MEAPQLEVADILRHYEGHCREKLGGRLSAEQEQVIRAIIRCRTAALGGHLCACDRCGVVTERYNSCRNRHCPKCQHLNKLQWLEARKREVLPVEYFHVVFTLPHLLHSAFPHQREELHRLLFRSSSRALSKIAADPQHLGAKIGFLSVLHTWGSKLQYHPHCHCIVPGGGFSLDGDAWVNAREGFLLPVTVLSSYFRGHFLAQLKTATERGELRFPRHLDPAFHPQAHRQWLDELYSKNWVVYSKPSFEGSDKVLEYLARYTYRVAISNRRLLRQEGDRVFFLAKGSAKDPRFRETSLEAIEFIRRFLLHVLPKGFVRIRYYGYMANHHRQKQLARARELIPGTEPVEDSSPAEEGDPAETWQERVQRLTGIDPDACPVCGEGRLVRVGSLRKPTATQPQPRPPPSR